MKNSHMSKLGDICSIRTGKLDSNAAVENGEYPFFTCAQETFRIDKFAFDTEAVLLGGNNANGIFPLKYYQGKFNAYQRTYIIESMDKEKVLNKFIYFSLRPVLAYFKSASIGATTQFLTKPILDNLKINLPEIHNQKYIVDLLFTYDNLIDNNRKRIQLLEESARLLFREWFVYFRFPGHQKVKIIDGIPDGWEKEKLSKIGYLNYGKSLVEETREEGDVKVYGSSGVVGVHSKYLVEGPGIIVGRKGNVGAIHWVNDSYWPIDTVYYIKREQSNLFLYLSLRTIGFINTDASVPGLNRDYAHSKTILVPTKDLLGMFLNQVNDIYNMVKILTIQNQKLAQARDLLLPRLMSGAIEV